MRWQQLFYQSVFLRFAQVDLATRPGQLELPLSFPCTLLVFIAGGVVTTGTTDPQLNRKQQHAT